jgi:holo-[acyl-carrier protein] synthase
VERAAPIRALGAPADGRRRVTAAKSGFNAQKCRGRAPDSLRPAVWRGEAGYLAALVILGAGIDVVEIARVEQALARHGDRLLTRLYTERERRACERRARAGPHFALRFAVKEAGMKALGTGWAQGVAWRDFETLETASGLALELGGRARELCDARGRCAAWLAASLTRTHAVAQVVLERVGR